MRYAETELSAIRRRAIRCPARKQAHAECGGPGVGVVGMCFTGNFALAMAVDDVVLAPVLSQPSLPFAIGRARRGDVGVSDGDLATVYGWYDNEWGYSNRLLDLAELFAAASTEQR